MNIFGLGVKVLAKCQKYLLLSYQNLIFFKILNLHIVNFFLLHFSSPFRGAVVYISTFQPERPKMRLISRHRKEEKLKTEKKYELNNNIILNSPK